MLSARQTIRVLTLVPAGLEASKAIEPAVADFGDPSARWVTVRITWGRDGLFNRRFLRDMRHQTFVYGQLTIRGRVVATVQHQVSASSTSISNLLSCRLAPHSTVVTTLSLSG